MKTQKVAMGKLREIDEGVKKFPGIDCVPCGCPNCLALTQDAIQGKASESDCLYVLKKATRGGGKEKLPRWKRPRQERKWR